MDTSETYIKMRLAAIPDLGKGQSPEGVDEDIITGQPYYLEQSDDIFIDAKGNWYYDVSNEPCQLERQDQLQEMSYERDDIFKAALVLLPMLAEKLNYKKLTSMEQLWLSYLMFQKYNKIWDGEDWVVSKVEAIK